MDARDLDPADDYIFTIGHSNTPIDVLLANIRAYSIEALVDVRSQPVSRFAPHFNRRALEETLHSAGVEYIFLGERLGGRPTDASLYDVDGRVRYDLWSEAEAFRAGIETLILQGYRSKTAMMCSEEDPQACHRHLLIARVLTQKGFDPRAIIHIRRGGNADTEASLVGQPALLHAIWRSPAPLAAKRRSKVLPTA